ncbi:MAG: SprT-like domain-containing protein [Halohasta sp.]
MSTADSQGAMAVGSVADDHELSHRARAYGEGVIRGNEWPIDDVDLTKITWATSTRAKRRHGRCSYDGGGQVTITLTEHTYERAGFAACKTTIRHELVHAWQYQHRGEYAIQTEASVDLLGSANRPAADTAHASEADADSGVDADGGGPSVSTATSTDPGGFEIDTGHGDSFRAWVEPLELPGRCSSYYERRRADFAYVYECPDCGEWWGKHRLCKSVRQAAHGGVGPSGYRYCVDCEVLLHLRAGDRFLAHGDHDDETIKAFVAGEVASTASAADRPLIDVSEATGTERPE